MARPSFHVHYLIFCTSVEYPDVHRPQRNSTLNGVDFVLEVPPGTEFPFVPDEFWLFARLYSRSDRTGILPPLSVTCVWLDSPNGHATDIWTHDLPRISFNKTHAVIDRGWVFRNTETENKFLFPGLGRYEFRLWHSMTRWPNMRVKAREYILLES